MITPNINSLNSRNKKTQTNTLIRKQDPYFCFFQEAHLSIKERLIHEGISLKNSVPRKYTPRSKQMYLFFFFFNIWQNSFKQKLIKRDREGHWYILIKRNIHQDSKYYVPSTRVYKLVKETLLQQKSHINLHIVI